MGEKFGFFLRKRKLFYISLKKPPKFSPTAAKTLGEKFGNRTTKPPRPKLDDFAHPFLNFSYKVSAALYENFVGFLEKV